MTSAGRAEAQTGGDGSQTQVPGGRWQRARACATWSWFLSGGHDCCHRGGVGSMDGVVREADTRSEPATAVGAYVRGRRVGAAARARLQRPPCSVVASRRCFVPGTPSGVRFRATPAPGPTQLGARRLCRRRPRAPRDPARACDSIFSLCGVARHPVRVNRPLDTRGLLPRAVDAHTRPCRGGSAKRWHGTVPNPG
jgi:hypothetical protein